MSSAKGSPLPRTEMDALLLGRLDELTVSEPSSRGRSLLGIILSILVLLLISSMIVAAIIIMNPDIANFDARRRQMREAISLEEALLGELSAREFSSQWLKSPADQLLYEDSKNLYLLGLPDHPPGAPPENRNSRFEPDVTLLVANASLLSSIDYQGFKLSPSQRYLLLWTEKRRQFRHSFTATYFLYDIKQDLITLLSTRSPDDHDQDDSLAGQHKHYANIDSASLYLSSASGRARTQSQDGQPSDWHNREAELMQFQLVEWFSSSGRTRSDSLILIQNNDIYVLPNVAGLSGSGESSQAAQSVSASSRPVRLTRTGRPGEIFNGLPDWLYEEEILSDSLAFQVSPDSRRLAYLSFNDSQVARMPITVYGEQNLPRVQQVRYPKAGQPNPRVSLHLVELGKLDRMAYGGEDSEAVPRPLQVKLPDELAMQQHYINRLVWLTSDRLGLVWSKRDQTESRVLICSSAQRDPATWTCLTSLKWRAQNGWLDIGDDLHALDDDHYLMLLPKFEGEQVGNFKHIAKVSLSQVGRFEFLTSGRKEVLAISGIDRAHSKLVYYISTLENEPGQRQLHSASLLIESNQKLPTNSSSKCITCSHYPSDCLFNYVRMSPSTSHYIFHCEGPEVPRVELRRHWVASSTASIDAKDAEDSGRMHETRLLWTIEDNRDLRAKLQMAKAMPVQVRLRVPIANTSYQASVMLLLPPLMGTTMRTFRTPPLEVELEPQTQNKLTAWSSRARRDLAHNFRMHNNNNNNNLESDPDSKAHNNSPSGPSDGPAKTTTSHMMGLRTLSNYISQLPANERLPQYPMVVDVYGGPNSQRVDQRFSVHLGHYFASSQRTVYAMIDGRGSGLEGSRRSFELRHRLGSVEVRDQIEVTRELTRGLLAPLVDPTKVAIWGWSYGGYAAALALAQSNADVASSQVGSFRHMAQHPSFPSLMTKLQREDLLYQGLLEGRNQPKLPGQTENSIGGRSSAEQVLPSRARQRGVFECAASVAPVTDWIYYDTAYTERYMSSPWVSERYKGADDDGGATSVRANQTLTAQDSNKVNERYQRASLIRRIAHVDRKRFLLVHGTADDNVHLQHSIMLMRELIRRNILFETRLYPDQDHSISQRADKLHFGATLSNFFAECFDMAH